MVEDRKVRGPRRRWAIGAVLAVLLTLSACTQGPGASPSASGAPAVSSPSAVPASPSPSGSKNTDY